jgi:hypothetical protein
VLESAVAERQRSGVPVFLSLSASPLLLAEQDELHPALDELHRLRQAERLKRHMCTAPLLTLEIR